MSNMYKHYIIWSRIEIVLISHVWVFGEVVVVHWVFPCSLKLVALVDIYFKFGAQEKTLEMFDQILERPTLSYLQWRSKNNEILTIMTICTSSPSYEQRINSQLIFTRSNFHACIFFSKKILLLLVKAMYIG